MKNDCLFCAIIAGEIPCTKVYEDEDVFAFRDINPQAPVHVLVLPKEHIACADAIDGSNSRLVGKCFEAIAKIAKAEGLSTGYRVINNCGKDAVAKGVKAGDIIKSITAIAGGKGGGKPDSAMGGGNDVSKLQDALNAVEGFVNEKI